MTMLHVVLGRMTSLVVDEAQFTIVKEQYRRFLSSFKVLDFDVFID